MGQGHRAGSGGPVIIFKFYEFENEMSMSDHMSSSVLGSVMRVSTFATSVM